MANELIRPIDENTAKAIEESARTLGKGFDLAGGLGAYLARALGGVPQNLIGILVGDWLIHKRVRRWSELQDETRQILGQRRVKEPYDDISPSIALPLIEAALDEDREGLKELWAKLLAAAMDSKRKHLVRADLISTLKQLEPLDAIVLNTVHEGPRSQFRPNVRDHLAQKFSVTSDEMTVCFQNLEKLGCFIRRGDQPPESPLVQENPNLGPRGRLLMLAVR
jgi:Abortive infection alpha